MKTKEKEMLPVLDILTSSFLDTFEQEIQNERYEPMEFDRCIMAAKSNISVTLHLRIWRCLEMFILQHHKRSDFMHDFFSVVDIYLAKNNAILSVNILKSLMRLNDQKVLQRDYFTSERIDVITSLMSSNNSQLTHDTCDMIHQLLWAFNGSEKQIVLNFTTYANQFLSRLKSVDDIEKQDLLLKLIHFSKLPLFKSHQVNKEILDILLLGTQSYNYDIAQLSSLLISRFIIDDQFDMGYVGPFVKPLQKSLHDSVARSGTDLRQDIFLMAIRKLCEDKYMNQRDFTPYFNRYLFATLNSEQKSLHSNCLWFLQFWIINPLHLSLRDINKIYDISVAFRLSTDKVLRFNAYDIYFKILNVQNVNIKNKWYNQCKEIFTYCFNDSFFEIRRHVCQKFMQLFKSGKFSFLQPDDFAKIVKNICLGISMNIGEISAFKGSSLSELDKLHQNQLELLHLMVSHQYFYKKPISNLLVGDILSCQKQDKSVAPIVLKLLMQLIKGKNINSLQKSDLLNHDCFSGMLPDILNKPSCMTHYLWIISTIFLFNNKQLNFNETLLAFCNEALKNPKGEHAYMSAKILAHWVKCKRISFKNVRDQLCGYLKLCLKYNSMMFVLPVLYDINVNSQEYDNASLQAFLSAISPYPPAIQSSSELRKADIRAKILHAIELHCVKSIPYSQRKKQVPFLLVSIMKIAKAWLPKNQLNSSEMITFLHENFSSQSVGIHQHSMVLFSILIDKNPDIIMHLSSGEIRALYEKVKAKGKHKVSIGDLLLLSSLFNSSAIDCNDYPLLSAVEKSLNKNLPTYCSNVFLRVLIKFVDQNKFHIQMRQNSNLAIRISQLLNSTYKNVNPRALECLDRLNAIKNQGYDIAINQAASKAFTAVAPKDQAYNPIAAQLLLSLIERRADVKELMDIPFCKRLLSHIRYHSHAADFFKSLCEKQLIPSTVLTESTFKSIFDRDTVWVPGRINVDLFRLQCKRYNDLKRRVPLQSISLVGSNQVPSAVEEPQGNRDGENAPNKKLRRIYI